MAVIRRAKLGKRLTGLFKLLFCTELIAHTEGKAVQWIIAHEISVKSPDIINPKTLGYRHQSDGPYVGKPQSFKFPVRPSIGNDLIAFVQTRRHPVRKGSQQAKELRCCSEYRLHVLDFSVEIQGNNLVW